MEDTKDTNPTPGTQISAEQAGEVGGGDGSSCPPTVQIGPVTLPGSSVEEALTNAYDGAVAAASHVIETVSKAVK
jgi:hypothetical protein